MGHPPQGIEVLTATDGDVGLAIAMAKHPDAIISDWGLPSRSVFLVLEYLRSNTDFDGVVVIATNNHGNRHCQYAKMLGVQAIVPKSIKFENLMDIVNRLLEKKVGTLSKQLAATD